MVFTWVRSQRGDGSWSTTQQNVLIASLTAGQTLMRSRIYWGFSGYTSTDVDLRSQMANFLVSGLVTTVGNGTEAVPDILLHAGNASPPTQRWLFWEGRHPIVGTWDGNSETVTWRDSGVQEAPDVEGQVLATGLPTGDTLNVWWATKAEFSWDPGGGAVVWASIVLGIKP